MTGSGSNRSEFSARGALDSVAGDLTARLSGPLERDRCWYALMGNTTFLADRVDGQGFAKLTTQLTPRHKLTSLFAGDSRQHAGYVGVIWEALFTDRLFQRSYVSLFNDMEMHGAARWRVDSWEVGTESEAFENSRTWGDHSFKLAVRGGATTVEIMDDPTASLSRVMMNVQDQWRITRHVTLVAGLGEIARWDTTGGSRFRPTGGGQIVWDVTNDGRTALRARMSTWRARPWITRSVTAPVFPDDVQVKEGAFGFEHEFGQSLVGGAEILERHSDIPMNGIGTREASLAFHLQSRRGPVRVNALYRFRLQPSPDHQLVALGSMVLARRISAGFLAVRGPRSSLATILPERSEPTPAPSAGPDTTAWLLGLQLHAELGGLLGLPTAVWLDALTTRDRGPEVRLGLRIDY